MILQQNNLSIDLKKFLNFKVKNKNSQFLCEYLHLDPYLHLYEDIRIQKEFIHIRKSVSTCGFKKHIRIHIHIFFRICIRIHNPNAEFTHSYMYFLRKRMRISSWIIRLRLHPSLCISGSVHVCEPHTHTIRGPITRWHVDWSSYNMLCVWASHTYYKRL